MENKTEKIARKFKYISNYGNLEKVSNAIGELEKYNFIRVEPVEFGFCSVMHFVYWDNRGYHYPLRDDRSSLHNIDKFRDDFKKYWLLERKKELAENFLTLGQDKDLHFLMPHEEVQFDFTSNKNPKQTLLMLYMGVPLLDPLKDKNSRHILFTKKDLDISKVIEKFKEEELQERNNNFMISWEKPALASALFSQRDVYPNLDDLFIGAE